jgi:hypothetical protein
MMLRHQPKLQLKQVSGQIILVKFCANLRKLVLLNALMKAPERVDYTD